MACSLLGWGLLLAGPALAQSQERVRPVPPAASRDRPAGHQAPGARQANPYRQQPAVPALAPVMMPIVDLADGTILGYAESVQPAGLQPALPPKAAEPMPDDSDYQIQLAPPGPQRLFRLESERELQERMRQEALQRPIPERIEFPKYEPLSTQPFAGRRWPPQFELVEPAYVCYRRLYFEDLNSERYGWDLGFVQPFVSAGKFFADVALLPYHLGTDWRRHHECNAGYCLPGDPVPYRLYPPGLSATGGLAETATILAILAIFPP